MELKTFSKNDDINNITALVDLIRDEYGNLYFPVRVSRKGKKLVQVTLSNFYYEESFAVMAEGVINQRKYNDKYKGHHLGIYMLDVLEDYVRRMQKSNRKMFSVSDLIANGTEVSFLDQTKIHPRSSLNIEK